MSVLPGAEPFLLETEGPTRAGVVLCHGFTGTPQSMRAWGEHLHGTGLTVICPRLPGHGTSWQEMAQSGWRDWYGELERAFDALRARMAPTNTPVFAMGLSMGGTLVTRLAEERGEEITGLVLVNPSYLGLRKTLRLVPALSRVIPWYPGIGSDIKKPGVRELSYTKTPLKALASLMEFWPIVRGDLAKVTQPLQVYRSAVDHVVEAESTRVLLASVSSAETEEIILPNSYHVATVDNDAETIFTGSAAFVAEHLSRLAQGPA
jgi:carboxylesterase